MQRSSWLAFAGAGVVLVALAFTYASPTEHLEPRRFASAWAAPGVYPEPVDMIGRLWSSLRRGHE